MAEKIFYLFAGISAIAFPINYWLSDKLDYHKP